MDILKELFGTSDELQINKSLFGSETSSAPVDLGLDHPLPSPSRDYLSNRPLPLLPVGVESRGHNVATSLLIRSHSLDDLHTSSGNEDDVIFRTADPLRAQSVFPQLSDTGTANHVDLNNVPPEMPMYLLEDDEGNDDEIMRLLETTPNHSGRTSVASGSCGRTSVASGGSPSGSCGQTSVASGSCGHTHVANVSCGQTIVASGSCGQTSVASGSCSRTSVASGSVSLDAAAIDTVAMEIVAMDMDEGYVTQNDAPVSIATTTSEEIATPTATVGSDVVSMVTIASGCHAYQGRRHSLSPPRLAFHSAPPLPPSLPLSPITPSHSLTPSLSTPIPTPATPSSVNPPQLAPPPGNQTPPPSNMQVNIDRLRDAVRVQGQRLEQALKTLLPSSGQTLVGQTTEPVLIPTTPCTTLPLTTNPVATSYASLKNTGLRNGTGTATTASSWPEINTAHLAWNTDKETSTGCYPSIRNTGLQAMATPSNAAPSLTSELPPVTMCSVATQAGSGVQRETHPVAVETRQATPPPNWTDGNHDNMSPVAAERSVSEERNVVTCEGEEEEGEISEVSSPLSPDPLEPVVSDLEEGSTRDEQNGEGGAPLVARGDSEECNKQIDETQNVTLNDEVMATSENADVSSPITSASMVTVTMATTSTCNGTASNHTPPVSSFHSTFSVHIPNSSWRVQPFRSIMGMRALPITILPPPTLTPSPTSQSGAGPDPGRHDNSPQPLAQRKKRRRNGGGWPKGKKRKIIESGIPKPPSTAYSLYLSEQRQSLGESVTFKTMSQLSKTMGRRWSQLPTHVKQVYQDRAVQDRQRYLDELKSHLTKKQKESPSCNLESVDAVLKKLVSTAEDNSVLLCHICELSFTSLHNKHSHLCSRSHTHSLLREIDRVVMTDNRQTGPGSMLDGMECGQARSRGEANVDCVSTNNDSEHLGMNCDGVVDDSGTKHGNETEPKETECDSGGDGEESINGPEIQDIQIDDQDIQIDDLDTPSDNVPNDDQVQHDDSVCNDLINEGDPHENGPDSVPHEDRANESLVAWAQDYAGMLTRLKQHSSRLDSLPHSPLKTGQISFLNKIRQEEQDLLDHVDTLLAILNSVTCGRKTS